MLQLPKITAVTIENIILVCIAILILVIIVNLANSYKERNTKSLKKKYIMLHGGFSKEEASRALERQIILLKKKHPEKRINWYIEKAIFDLERDRKTHR